MLRNTIFFAVLLALFCGSAVAQIWENGPDTGFEYTRIGAAYFPGDDLIYVPGGRLADATTDGSIWSFDPVTGVSTDTGFDMPVPISNFHASVVTDAQGTAIYTIGGRADDGTMINAVQAFYPGTGAVEEITTDPFPGEARLVGGQVVVDNRIYIFGGFTGTVMFDDTWVFDPMAAAGSRWTDLGVSMSVARAYTHCAAVDGKIYACGGTEYTVDPALTSISLVEVFDPANPGAGWVVLPSIPDATGEGPTFGFDTGAGHAYAGKLIIAGGGQWPDDWTNCYIYDVATEVWDTFPSIINARRDHAGAFYPGGGGQLWIFGGRQGADTTVLTQSEFYDFGFVTPTLTVSPVTATATPSMTPTNLTPTVTPSTSATPIITATATATATGTATEVITVTPSPTLTPTEINIDLQMPAVSFGEGDTCYLDLQIVNEGTEQMVDLYVLLAVGSEFWSYPTWAHISEGLGHETLNVPASSDDTMNLIPEFSMPPVSPFGPIFFYAAMFDEGFLALDHLASNGDVFEFSLE